ncbi:MAG: retropepsin-like aspartic protease [Candidatus Aenigmarchaeota archaeon]|nr:retropepsin-like aspartic protease [Candidatus Aenigmarchaeota archaeon]MDI6721992.1 retropepsin-like aspartic protease [Candidatus Aenigmarchaeota archaeon]
MINIPSQTEYPKNLREEGPIIELIFSIPDMMRKRLMQENIDVPKSQKVNALIDTGASDSFIDSEIAEKLKLHPINVKPIQIDTGSDSKVTNTYFLRAEFPKIFRILDI